MAWYKAGTITVTNGSAIVSGTGTAWANNVNGVGAGQMIVVPGSGTVQVYEILSVESNTSLTLTTPFTGTTAAGSGYAILTFYVDSEPDFSRRLAAQLTYYQSQLDIWNTQIAGKAANGANSDITSLSGLTTALSIAQGGTGAKTAPLARTALGAAASGANSDITSLNNLTTDLSIAQGGTGASTAAAALVNLGAAARGINTDITSLRGVITAPLFSDANAITYSGWQYVNSSSSNAPTSNGATSIFTNQLTATVSSQIAHNVNLNTVWTRAQTGAATYTPWVPLAKGGANSDITSLSGLTTALSISQGGTGSIDAPSARSALGVAYGTTAGTVAQGNDTRLNTVDGKTGGSISTAVAINANGSTANDLTLGAGGSGVGCAPWNATSNNFIRMSNTANDATSGNFVNSIAAGYYTGRWSIGGVRGAGTDLLSVQLNVSTSTSGTSAGFSFFPNGRMQALNYIHLGGRVTAFTGVQSTYLEVAVDGSTKGINFFDSDETLKENILDADGKKALDIIGQVRPVSYKFKDYTYKSTERDDEGNDVEVEGIQKGDTHQFGVIAQEFEKLLPEGIRTSSDGKKSLDPLEVLGLLLTTCHEQQKLIRQLQADVALIKNT